MPLQFGKKPIVVPRQAKYNEHVNDHQLYFCKEVEKRMGSIDVVENVNELANIIEQHDIEASNSTMNSNNRAFCDAFGKVVNDLLCK